MFTVTLCFTVWNNSLQICASINGADHATKFADNCKWIFLHISSGTSSHFNLVLMIRFLDTVSLHVWWVHVPTCNQSERKRTCLLNCLLQHHKKDTFYKRFHKRTDLWEGPLYMYLFSSAILRKKKIRMTAWRHQSIICDYGKYCTGVSKKN